MPNSEHLLFSPRKYGRVSSTSINKEPKNNSNTLKEHEMSRTTSPLNSKHLRNAHSSLHLKIHDSKSISQSSNTSDGSGSDITNLDHPSSVSMCLKTSHNESSYTSSVDSSSTSSRRHSLVNNIHELNGATISNLPKLSLQKQVQLTTPSLYQDEFTENLYTPESASTTSLSTEKRTFGTPLPTSSKNSALSMNDRTPSDQSYNSDELSSSSTSIPTRTSKLSNKKLSNQRLYQRQYVLNEKLYLEGMKNMIIDDEYYTKAVVAPPVEKDDHDEENENDNNRGSDVNKDMFDFKVDNIFDLRKYDPSDIDGHKTKDIFRSRKNPEGIDQSINPVSISPGYLLHKLKWIQSVDSENNKLMKEIVDKLSNYDEESIGNDRDSLYKTIQQLFQKTKIAERFEWQTMLSNVLKGDILRSEKTRIAKEGSTVDLNNQYADEIWIELRAWMNGRTTEDQKRSLKLHRNSVDPFFEDIMSFKINNNVSDDEVEQLVVNLLNEYYKVLNFWPNIRALNMEKPITRKIEFIARIDALNSWFNAKINFQHQAKTLEEWIGINDLPNLFTYELKVKRRKFAELLIKERDIEVIFQKKIFFPLAPWILKAKIFNSNAREIVKEMNLKYSSEELKELLLFPSRLLKEIILIRIEYAKKVHNPTMMMIDQMIDDFSSYIRLSVQLKYTLVEYCSGWLFTVDIDPEFERIVVDAIHYLFILLQLKVLDDSNKKYQSFREPEILMKFWEELKNVGHYIDNSSEVIADGFTKLTLRLLQRMNSHILLQLNSPLDIDDNVEAELWLVHTFDNLGSMKRKLDRFTNLLTKAFENSVTYKIDDYDVLLKSLRISGHFLIYSGGELEENGIYLIGSPELLGIEDSDLFKIINSSDIGSDLIPKLEIKNSLSIYNATEVGGDPNIAIGQNFGMDGVPYHNIRNELNNYTGIDAYSNMHIKAHNINKINKKINKSYTDSKKNHSLTLNNISVEDAEREILELELKLHTLGYVLVLVPDKPLLWEGETYNLSGDNIIKYDTFTVKHCEPDTLTLINQGSCYALEYQCDRFQQMAEDSVSFLERRCVSDNIEGALQKINKIHYHSTYNVLNNYPLIIEKFKKMNSPSDLLNNAFLFSRDFGNTFLRTTLYSYEKKSLIILLMVKLSIDWLTYLVEECDPNDKKTFRWCVTAMEFTFKMINGLNILALDEDQFTLVKQKISACMSLLISHFDVMGARASEVEKIHQHTRANIDIDDDFDIDTMLQINSQLRINSISKLEETRKINPHQIGKVLDDKVKVDKYLTSLASSMSNVSIRWQKRKFIGGGTFGTVYSAINLDNGDILAVKEIKIQDTNTMEKIFPSIKEEMSVLEMMNHPNIVQYYGVEVHRDRVNIFMEYCEGGSLASLLEHGRVEDEMVTQVYSLELLEGLAYLHESGVVHRDIKPENILLDFNGIIKYVDFGAARKIVKNGTMMQTSTVDNNGQTNENDDSTINKNENNDLHNMIGTPMYMAPESITGAKEKGRFGADDIWALGCVILEMITGRRPWANLDNEWAIMYHVAAGQTPQLPNKDEVSDAGRLFLQRCLIQNPNKRATTVELLMDTWIVEIREIAFGDGNQVEIDERNVDSGNPILVQ